MERLIFRDDGKIIKDQTMKKGGKFYANGTCRR